jgi:hypothetical protein
VGVNVDLGGLGQRRSEADPFATSGGGQPVAHTEEKHKTKTKEKEVTPPTTSFDDIKLTGVEAKDATDNPPGRPINVSDEVPPPEPPTTAVALTMDDLQKAQAAYEAAINQYLTNNPKYVAALKQYTDNASGKAGSTQEKAFQKAYGKMVKIREDYKNTDEGKKLFADWMKAYQAVNKPGADIADNLVPPDKLEQAQHAVAAAENALKKERDLYEAMKQGAINDSAGVKSTQAAIDDLKKKPHYSEKEAQADRDKLKQLESDLAKAKEQIAKDWASTPGANQQMKTVQAAEKSLDQAKQGAKPFDQLEQKTKSASNP